MGVEGVQIGFEELLRMKFCFDSRKIEKDCVFVAIKGERHDGHDFVKEALEKGASLAIVERPIGTGREIVVENVIDFLLELASRKISKAEKIVGITGASGKTFTKDLLATLIPGSFKTKGNMNTEIGLPITVLNDYEDQRIAILEMGMDRPGDIERLSKVAKPDVGVVLNIGIQHVGVAGSEDALFRANMELVDVSKEVVYNADDRRIRDYVSKTGKGSLGFGMNLGDVILKDWEYEGWRTRATYKVFGEILNVELEKFWHRGHLLNLAAALCVLKLLGIEFDEDLLEGFEFPKMRFNQKYIGGVFVIDDTYNASLSAFEVAIEAMKKMPFEKRFAVVGPVKELGRWSEEVHGKISMLLEEIDGVFVYSKDEEAMYLKPRNELYRSDDPEVLASKVVEVIEDGDVVIFKASRSVAIEDILKRFEEMMRWS